MKCSFWLSNIQKVELKLVELTLATGKKNRVSLFWYKNRKSWRKIGSCARVKCSFWPTIIQKVELILVINRRCSI